MSISLTKLSGIVHHKRKNVRKITLEELSGETNINKDTLSRIENGRFYPSIEQLNILMEALRFSLKDIEENPDEKKVFLAMMGSATTENERVNFDKMISMMLCLRKHDRLRKRQREEMTSC
ncbi:helix-turn-helix domain-containing protein [Paenibacillus lutimineralis]|uniref:XRE family transcriptional regulator n=1 Tax=Paenibacillus lutimineralis TaxID=2707005 RepID=A0A3S9USJ3_9BACL|nr:helix-turn-helix transcriptional regulator [Paenibacillus lutimineralis]AZS13231.1 XRE family transcriptional regulator [Paenibacillus lutimineralis]